MNSINLKEAKKLKLQDRVEKKYLCTESQLSCLIEYATNNGFVIVADGDKSVFKYTSIS